LIQRGILVNYMRIFSRKNSGVTLMELIVAMTIVGFIVVAVITYNLIGEKYYQSTSGKAAVLNDAQYLMRKIGQDLQEAKAVEFTSNQLSITTFEGSDIIYEQDGTDIKLEGEILASNVEEENGFVVQELGDNKAWLSISVGIGTGKNREEAKYEATFYMRNKE
jgi:prepilin-type N-terminal cleavage/methylation domain-containing protein